MKPLMERLQDEVLVCDGAMGTQLLEKGLGLGECPEYFGINNKKILLDIHKSYIKAGADMIITNTFGANRIKLQKFKLQDKLQEINSQAVKIAKDAADNKTYVLGGLGPMGEYIKPVGNLSFDDCYKAFLEQAKIFESEGVEAIIIETMTGVEELKAAIMAVKEKTKLPVIASMAFDKTAQGSYRTTSGVSIPQLVSDALMAGADTIGANCGVDITDMVEIIKEMRPLSTAFIIAQPNAGKPKLQGDKTVYEQSPGEFAGYIPQLIKSGANIIGGCCGTTPEHIKYIREAVNSR